MCVCEPERSEIVLSKICSAKSNNAGIGAMSRLESDQRSPPRRGCTWLTALFRSRYNFTLLFLFQPLQIDMSAKSTEQNESERERGGESKRILMKKRNSCCRVEDRKREFSICCAWKTVKISPDSHNLFAHYVWYPKCSRSSHSVTVK